MILDRSGFDRAIKGLQAEAGIATKASLAEAAKRLQAAAKANASGQPRDKEGSRVFAGVTRSGRARIRIGGGSREGGPGVVTGRLRAGIQRTAVRKRGNTYSVQVGASRSTPYARSMELGNPRWHRKGGYPFLTPAYRAERTQFARNIRTYWAAAVTGSKSHPTLD